MEQLGIAGWGESEGVWLKEKGMSRADKAVAEVWKEACDQAILYLATTSGDFTAEDIRLMVGDPPFHPNAMGARFNAAGRRGQIEKVGFREAERGSAHRRVLTVWRGVAT
jgi:hypothetical protein